MVSLKRVKTIKGKCMVCGETIYGDSPHSHLPITNGYLCSFCMELPYERLLENSEFVEFIKAYDEYTREQMEGSVYDAD